MKSQIMKVKSIILCLMMATVSFAGCLGNNDTVITEEGDPVVLGELPDDWPTYYVATANDLPNKAPINPVKTGKTSPILFKDVSIEAKAPTMLLTGSPIVTANCVPIC